MRIFNFQRRTLVLAAVAVIGAAYMSGFGAYGQTKSDDIVKMFKLSGVDKSMNAVITQYRQLLPNVPSAFWDKMEKKFGSEFISKCVPIYDKYYTHDEIKQLIKFYESPIGKKSIATTPVILQESMAIGAEMGKQIAEDLANEGYGR